MSDTEMFKHRILPMQPKMQHLAEVMLGNEDNAADVVQDCFVSLWNDRERLRDVVNLEAWCKTMVKRKCIDLIRKRKPTVEIDERMDMAEEQDGEEKLQLAFRLIDRLPQRQAQVVRLKHYDGQDTQGIAAAMQISEGNVYVLLSRAYNTLKQMIIEYEKD